jgi:hypothetical protein
MQLPNEILPLSSFKKMHLLLLKQLTILDELIKLCCSVLHCQVLTHLCNQSKILVSHIQILDLFKSNILILHSYQPQHSPTQHIYKLVFLPILMFHCKHITLQNLNSSHMSLVGFHPNINELRHLMVFVQDEFLQKQ